MITLIMSTKTYLSITEGKDDCNYSIAISSSSNIRFDDTLEYGTIVVHDSQDNNVMRIN